MNYFINIDGKGYELSKFTEHIRIEIYKMFRTPLQPNGWINFDDARKAEDYTSLLKTAYLMLKNKEDFPTYEDFYNKVTKHDNSISICTKIYAVVSAAMSNAAPTDIVDTKTSKKKQKIIFLCGIISGICLLAFLMWLKPFLVTIGINF